jgi:hypothetical protein
MSLYPTSINIYIFSIEGGGFIAVLSNYVKKNEDYAANKRDIEVISQMNMVNGSDNESNSTTT